MQMKKVIIRYTYLQYYNLVQIVNNLFFLLNTYQFLYIPSSNFIKIDTKVCMCTRSTFHTQLHFISIFFQRPKKFQFVYFIIISYIFLLHTTTHIDPFIPSNQVLFSITIFSILLFSICMQLFAYFSNDWWFSMFLTCMVYFFCRNLWT